MYLSLGNSDKCSLDAYATWVSVVMKYYKSVEAIPLLSQTYKNVIREEPFLQVFDIKNVEIRESKDYSVFL